MYLHVKKTTKLYGNVTPPSSKSQCIRGIIFGLLSSGTTRLLNPLQSDDVNDAMRVCQNLGAEIALNNNALLINSIGLPLSVQNDAINTGNSGITTHFIMPLLGLRKNPDSPLRVDCNEQMRQRPIQSFITTLRSLGLIIEYEREDGRLPITIHGELKGGTAEVDGITSQYISALLIALPCAKSSSTIIVKNLHERPYMEMTLYWLKMQNIQYSHQHEDSQDIFHIQGNQVYQPRELVIPGDFSSASYLIAAAVLLNGRVILNGLNMHDPQGDKQLITILQTMGADINATHEDIVINGGKPLQGIIIDANDIPDLLPTLAVIGTFASGKTTITNVPHARIKETDRIHSITDGLLCLGAKIEQHGDGITVQQSNLIGTKVNGYGDHRTVMALAIAGLIADGETIIEGSEAINKTFPTFVELMQSLGALMDVKS